MTPLVIRTRKKILLSFAILIALGVIWYLFIANTFIRVQLAAGSDRYTISSTYSGKRVEDGKKSGLVHIPRGQYFVRSYKENVVAGIDVWHTPIVPFTKLDARISNADEKESVPVVGDFANFATQLTDGSYIYLNTRNKAVDIATSTGIKDMSSGFNLSTGTLDTYDHVVSILQTKGGSAIVVTTKEVYLVNSATSINVLNPYQPSFSPNYYGATYDNVTNSVLLLNAYDKNVYMFNLSQPYQGLSTLYTADKQIQAITAGAGKAILYGNNFPSTASNVLKKYSQKVQTSPIEITISSKTKTNTFNQLGSPTMIAVSPQGTYLAVKQKFSTLLTVYNTSNKQSEQIPSYNISGLAWAGNTLYIGRDNAIWSYQAGSGNTSLKKIADIGSAITGITAQNDQLIVTSINNSVQTISFDGATQVADFNDVKNLVLTNKGYNVIFSNISNNLYVDTETSRQLGDQADVIDPIINTLKSAFPSSKLTLTSGENLYNGTYIYAAINLTLQ